MVWRAGKHRSRRAASAGWEAALLEFEHQAEHWDTPDHGETGHLIASVLRAAVDIAHSGGILCDDHQHGSLPRVGSNAGNVSSDLTVTQAASNRRNRNAA